MPCGARVLGLALARRLRVAGGGRVGARPFRGRELVAGAAVLLDRPAAGRQVELAILHRHDAAEHVDGRYAVWVVSAVLAYYAKGQGA